MIPTIRGIPVGFAYLPLRCFRKARPTAESFRQSARPFKILLNAFCFSGFGSQLLVKVVFIRVVPRQNREDFAERALWILFHDLIGAEALIVQHDDLIHRQSRSINAQSPAANAGRPDEICFQ